MRSLPITILAVVMGACLPLPGGHALMSLPVADKSGTTTLVSDDGSSCEVSETVFASIRVGDHRACAWRRARGSQPDVRRGRIPAAGRPPVVRPG